MCFVDHHEIERWNRSQRRGPRSLPANSRPTRYTPGPKKVPCDGPRLDGERFASSFCTGRIRDFGTIRRMRCGASARRCAMTSPASIVFPNPTHRQGCNTPLVFGVQRLRHQSGEDSDRSRLLCEAAYRSRSSGLRTRMRSSARIR